MKDGFIKVAAATPVIKVADCRYNADRICELIREAEDKGIKVIAFPELCITGYTCGDLFLQGTLLAEAEEQLIRIMKETAGRDVLAVVSLPYEVNCKLYITAAVLQNGRLLGMIPKHFLPNYAEFSDARYFMRGNRKVEYIDVRGESVPFGMNLLFQNRELKSLIIGVEICEDLWMPQPPSGSHVVAGATMIVNPSASDELAGKRAYRRELIKNLSGRMVCGYLYADAGEGESTTDLVFSGHNLIVENGSVLAESALFTDGLTVSEIDLDGIISARRRMTSYDSRMEGYVRVDFSYEKLSGGLIETKLTRHISKNPFIPENKEECDEQCEEILSIQAAGLKGRLRHIGAKNAVIGISGGLDSTLALLVTAKAFDLLNLDKKGIIAVTMPCFGTSDRTYGNALKLISRLGATLIEINIRDAVSGHFRDIGHPEDLHDVTFENAQARERTQILMDLANKYNGIVVGTGDMSELALGWATYNGDHMSMYGVNASVPKTLVRRLTGYVAEKTDDDVLKEALLDVIATPVSPELLPPKDGNISQKTEDLVGPYELHDFFMYYILKFGFTPEKILRLARTAFEGEFDDSVIEKWLRSFYRRFFSQQYKRSCMPDGPKTGVVGLSPRGDLKMPSDASASAWLASFESK